MPVNVYLCIERATTVLWKTRKPFQSHPKRAPEQAEQAGIFLLTENICIGMIMENNRIELDTHYTFLTH